MKAIRLPTPDGIDALSYEDVSRPEPDPNELLIRVHAAGVNPLDWLISEGTIPDGLLDEPFPWVPGWDVSGVVASVGSDVDEFESGDVVFGMVRLPGAGGTFAEYVTTTAEEVTQKPDALTHTEAAGVPMAGQTAFHALYEEAGLECGQRVLVHAAAGGVGHMAVQFATNSGAEVIGTASSRNEAYLRELGVDEFVNYREQRFEEVVEDVDVVLDTVGGDVLERSVELAAPDGVVVTLPAPPGDERIRRFRDEHGVAVRFFDVVLDSAPSVLGSVSTHVEAGVVAPTISDTYGLAEARAALDRSAEGHVRGKLVLDLSEAADD
jgi:NADPH:quinone reductase-like Zn-dependent oxidoreductase